MKLQATHAGIILAVDLVLRCIIILHYSFNSSSSKSDLFCRMFPECSIAKNFACGKTKCSYLISFIVAPYFKLILDYTLSSIDKFVASFDESFNPSSKTDQMDLHITYWDTTNNCVTTHYYNSEFMGKASAQDIYEKFEQCLEKLENNKLIPVSCDGPDLNLAFLDILNNKRSNDELRYLSTCGLHSLDNSFKYDEKASGWKINKLLKSIYKIFDESLSGRADYEQSTSALSSDYPLQFCSHRWLENEQVIKRAREIFEKIKEIIDFWKQLPKSKQPGRGIPAANTIYEHPCSLYKDPLILVKLQFFEGITADPNHFLVLFQCNKPMVPFLVESLDLIRTLCSKFIKRKILESARTTYSLLKLDLTDTNKQKNISEADL